MAEPQIQNRVGGVVLAVSVSTGLSLFGDSALYTVLPLNFEVLGVTLGQVGLLLSINRVVRLLLNAPAGLLIDRWPRRRLFVPALFIGALSTALYAITSGFPWLLAARVLWGIAWTGIWIGGNSIILDITTDGTRGRQVGWYQAAFFLGAAAGALLGGLFTDWLGFRSAMTIGASLTLLGAIGAVVALPETQRVRRGQRSRTSEPIRPAGYRFALVTANLVLGITRFAMAGVVAATVGLYLNAVFGDTVVLYGRPLGVTTLTGLALGGNILISMMVVPFAGRLSDRSSTPWKVVTGSLLIGLLGFVFLAQGTPFTILTGLLLAATMGGSLTGLATVLIGGLGGSGDQGKRLGVLYTVGDLGSAIGPPMALALLPFIAFSGLYLSIAVGLGILLLMSIWILRVLLRTVER